MVDRDDPEPPPLVSDEALQAVTVGERIPHDAPVTLVEYNAAWPERFEVERRQIVDALGATARSIEHTGSTSVPGLAAKPIIDITMAVPDSADESAYVPQLEAAGYTLRIREPHWHDHRMLRRPDGSVQLHVFSEASPEIVRMVGFRDWLRGHPDDRARYEATKRELGSRTWRHVQHYADAKTAIVEEIIARAGLPPGTRFD